MEFKLLDSWIDIYFFDICKIAAPGKGQKMLYFNRPPMTIVKQMLLMTSDATCLLLTKERCTPHEALLQVPFE